MLGSVICISPLGVAKADTLAVNGSIKKGSGHVCSVFFLPAESPHLGVGEQDPVQANPGGR